MNPENSGFGNVPRKSEYENECRLLSNALWGTDYPLINPDYDSIFANLQSQTVETLPAGLVLSLPGISDETVKRWKLTSLKRVDTFYRILQAAAKLDEILGKENITYAIVKGNACSLYYPEPSYRVGGDVDFIVPVRDFNKAYLLLVKNGFRDTKSDFSRHEVFEYDGIEFEMHRYFALKGREDENAEAAAELDEIVIRELEHPVTVEIDGYSFPMLSWLANGLVIIQHVRHHLKNALGLRQVIDWMLYCDRVLDENRSRELCEALEACGLLKLAQCLTKTCCLYLGMPSEKVRWCEDTDDRLCDELFRHIIGCGNMGENKSDPVAKVFKYKNGPRSLFRNLRQRGLEEWDAAKKHKFLRPFAGIYKFFKIIFHAVKRGVTPKMVTGAVKSKSDTDRLMAALGCRDNFWGE